MNRLLSIALLSVACATPLLSARGQAATARKPGASKLRPVTAYVSVNNQERLVTFVDRTRDTVSFVLGERPVGARQTIEIAQFDAVFFDLGKIDWGELHMAVRRQQWTRAIRLLAPFITPLLPYLDLPENNGVEYALSMGDYMMRAANLSLQAARTPKQREAAEEQYRRAYTVLRRVQRAEWSSAGQIADLKSLQCLLALDRPQAARKLFQEAIEPNPGDRAYGLYWLIRAQLDLHSEDFRAAMEAAVKSLCFENKDIDTFPDALMISARCYEELLEWYRARDVYYEVARIFPKTDWSRAARARLQFIMDKELTKAEEKSAVETVFFGLQEDMNKLVRDLLAEQDKDEEIPKPSAEAADPDEDADLKVFD